MKQKQVSIKQIYSIVLIVVLILIISNTAGYAKELIVDMSDTDTYHSIQEAIDDASPDDLIKIAAGTYEESLVINKPVTLKGVDKSNTTITSLNQTAVIISSNGVTMQDLSVEKSSTGIIMINATDCTLFNITIKNNIYGIIIDEGSINCTVYRTNFMNNTIHAIDHANGTIWSQYQLGNYWDSYQGIDNNSDGIGDTPFFIDENSEDPYPLISPITIKPNASFTFNPVNPTTQTPVEFTDLSVDRDGNIINWTWKEDGVIFSYDQQPTHQFSDNGAYEIMLTVTDDMYASHTYTRTIDVENVPPTVSFTYHPELPLDIQAVECIDTSYDPDGAIINRTWIINESYYYGSDQVRHTFPDDGIYSITLFLIDDDNASSFLTQEITVKNAGPISGFSYYSENGSMMKNTEITFKQNAVDTDGTIVEYLWDFGDGSTEKTASPSHTYGKDGLYKISLTVTDDDGASDSYSDNVRIGEKKDPVSFISGLSSFDIFIVVFILILVVFVIIVSKKYA